MALVLGMREGERFFVGDVAVRVIDVDTGAKFTLEVDDAFTRRIVVKNDSRVEILPEVYASAGFGSAAQVRVLLEAPKHIRILREKHYEENHK